MAIIVVGNEPLVSHKGGLGDENDKSSDHHISVL